ncbi:phage integrase [Burkholderia aenigmatica]|uniref:Phage integrase n=1 Tax=Burkholderia aenigmatica TaxID=2015348 RepID=A0A6P2HC38_9BURK|nr:MULTISPECIES: VPA1269 family protein [Burkholderia]VWB14163.1 phage integrase [Burkholderia aenigmatica]
MLNSLFTFPCPGAQAEVLLNLSPDLVHVAPELTEQRLLDVIAEHERIRTREFWEHSLLAEDERGSWIVAFKTRRDPKGHPAPAYLQSNALQRVAGRPLKGAELNSYLRRLPLAEQRERVMAVLPASRSELAGVLVYSPPAFAPDFREMLAEAGTPQSFVHHLAKALRGLRNPPYHAPRYLELMYMLWARNYILFPAGFRAWTVRQKWEVLRNDRYTGDKAPLVKLVTEALRGTDTSEFQSRTYGLLTASSLTLAGELSLELIDAYEAALMAETEQLEGNALHSAKSFVTRTAQVFRLLFNQAHPALAVARTQTRSSKAAKPAELVKTSGEFLWLGVASPELSGWGDLMRRYVGQLTTARIAGQVSRLNHFADFLLSLENPPGSPLELDRPRHIYDATLTNDATYSEYLRKRLEKSAASAALSLLRRFLDWYADYLLATGAEEAATFKNPILTTDTLGKGGRNSRGQTARNALPSYVIEEMKSLLIDDDFAFGKSHGSHYVRVLDNTTGKPVRVWFPAATVCLYLMLEAPIRSHQARWMDSGELDELVYEASTNRLVKNASVHAIAGRREAVLRLQHDALRKTDWFGLWVNTNKTAKYDEVEPGYSIPYVSDQLVSYLKMMRAWQQRYNTPMAAPIPYYGEKHSAEERERIQAKGPQVTPIFRDPAKNRHDAPITYDRLATFYTNALAEVQERIKRKHGHDIQLVSEDENGELKWAVDLHTLRVSGITAMIESGVPLEVVSQFVAGHTTLVMTLHYLRYSPLKLQKMLKEAHEKASENVDFVGSESFMQNLDAFAPYLLGQEGAGQGPGLGALREKTGIITITSEGICPGTSCSTGGPLDSTRVQHGPVPGGQRCGLCRYWITGPAHLLGQVAAVNNLAYTIRKKGLEVAQLNDERLDAEDVGNQKNARQIRDRVDVLNRELAIDIEEWTARYRYAEQSVSQLNAYLEAKAKVDGDNLPVPLLTAGTASELKVTLEEAHEFALLDQITQMADFVTGFRNREAELEKNTILSRMLAANGVKPFLLTLSDEHAHEAGNLLSALLLQQVKHRDLDDVLSGRTKLSAYPQLTEKLKALETATDTGELLALQSELLSLGENEQTLTHNNEETFA